MSNALVGDLYQLVVIDRVISESRTAFEEYGVAGAALEELRQGWQQKISAKNTAEMPWDPKPVQQPPQPVPQPPSAISNGLTPSSYTAYDTPPSNPAPRVKQESGIDSSFGGLPNGYGAPQSQQGGAARAAQLMQQQYGQAASASVNAMQQRGGGLALPGAKPQLHLPAQSPQMAQQQYSQQQQQAIRQQQQYSQQPQIKLENDSPHLPQQGFPQQNAQPNYGQTDGADDDEALDEWRTMLAQRRAIHAQHSEQADHLMRDSIQQHSAELQSGLMMPLDQLPSKKRAKRTIGSSARTAEPSSSSIAQMDGNLDDPDEDEKKVDVKDESDEDAINSDLDDDDDDAGELNDEDDDTMDTILCTYDKVQRVKNKWKCTLRDGIMSSEGKEWIFAKGMGEFEW